MNFYPYSVVRVISDEILKCELIVIHMPRFNRQPNIFTDFCQKLIPLFIYVKPQFFFNDMTSNADI